MKKIITIKRSGLGTNIVVRSPFSRKWLFNVTLAPMQYGTDEALEDAAWAGKAGIVACIGTAVALLLGACSSPTESKDKGPITIQHPTACVYMDSLNVEYVKKLEAYSLKVSPLSRARCHGDDGYITCSSRSGDTLYTVETACPVKAVK